MSYILDALKKSETERRAAVPAGGVGGAVYVVDAAPGFTGWRPLALATLAVAVLAAFAIWPRGEPDAVIAAAPPPATEVLPPPMPAKALPPPAEAPPPLPAALAAPVPPPAPVVTARPQPARDSGPLPRRSADEAPTATRAATAKARTPDRGGPARAPVVAATVASPPPIAAVRSPSPPATTAAVVSRTAGAAASSASIAPAGAPPAEARAGVAVAPPPTVAPPAVAVAAATPPPARDVAVAGDGATAAAVSELPRLVVSGFAGGDDRDARFAVINDRIVREGEEFAPDLRLTHVGQDGVVVEYRGKRYRP